jgi:hypothetical protein
MIPIWTPLNLEFGFVVARFPYAAVNLPKHRVLPFAAGEEERDQVLNLILLE